MEGLVLGDHARTRFQEQPLRWNWPRDSWHTAVPPVRCPKLHQAQIYGEIFNLSLPLGGAERITPHVFTVCTRSPVMFPPLRVQFGCKSEACRGRPEHVRNTPAPRPVRLSRDALYSFVQFETSAFKARVVLRSPWWIGPQGKTCSVDEFLIITNGVLVICFKGQGHLSGAFFFFFTYDKAKTGRAKRVFFFRMRK